MYVEYVAKGLVPGKCPIHVCSYESTLKLIKEAQFRTFPLTLGCLESTRTMVSYSQCDEKCSIYHELVFPDQIHPQVSLFPVVRAKIEQICESCGMQFPKQKPGFALEHTPNHRGKKRPVLRLCSRIARCPQTPMTGSLRTTLDSVP